MGEQTNERFARAGWVVYPSIASQQTSAQASREVLAWKERMEKWKVQFERVTAHLKRRRKELTQRRSDQRSREEGEVQEAIIFHHLRAAEDWYSLQPYWLLRDVRAQDFLDASAIAAELLDKIREAAIERDFLFARRADLQKHGWKHVSFERIEAFTKAKGPPGLLLEMVGKSLEEIRKFISHAAEGMPEAVARLEYLFPTEEDKRELLEELPAYYPAGERPPRIPIAIELAMDWVDIAIRAPDSPAAERARKNLAMLTSPGVIKGGRAGKGRPAIPHPHEKVSITYIMSYGLSRQLHEVARFLRTYDRAGTAYKSTLTILCPWVRRLSSDLTSLLSMSNTEIARELAALILDISPSKVDKMVYRGRGGKSSP